MRIIFQLASFLGCCLLAACVSHHEAVTDYYVIPRAGNEVPPSSRQGPLGSPGYVAVQPVLFNIKTSNLVSKLIVGERVDAIHPPVFIAAVQTDGVVVTNASGQRYDIPVMNASDALHLQNVILQKMQRESVR